jgi:hypothetical protein
MIAQPERYQTIEPGTILIERNAHLPDSLGFEDQLTESGWAQMMNKPDRRQLEMKLAAAGWVFFYIAGAMHSIAFGFAKPRIIQAALKRLIAAVRLLKCNCLEIDAIAARSFLGMTCIRLSAHSRHIQKGLVFENHSGTTE